MRKLLFAATVLGGLVAGQGIAHACDGVEDCGPTALPLDGGWVADTASNVGADTFNTLLTFTLTEESAFSITDDDPGNNTYQVSGAGFTTLSTAAGLLPTYWTPGVSAADTDWANAATFHGQELLGPGSYSLTVTETGDVLGPPTLFERVDPIPEPASLTLLGAALIGLGLIRRRHAST